MYVLKVESFIKTLGETVEVSPLECVISCFQVRRQWDRQKRFVFLTFFSENMYYVFLDNTNNYDIW